MGSVSLAEGDSVASAVRIALRALVAVANRQGLWEAFHLRPGGSQSWSTAVVLHAMGLAFRACPDLIIVPLFQRSWTRAWVSLCKSRAADGSIGFNPATPSDADSTIWLRRALEQRRLLGAPDPMANNLWIEQADRFIASHLGPNGVHTYTSADGILNYVGLDPSLPSGWLAAHGCVTLNYLALRRELSLLSCAWEFPTPLPQPYWWPDRAISAWLISSAAGFMVLDQDFCRLLIGQTDNSLSSISAHDLLRQVLDLQLPSGLWLPRFTLQVPNHADHTGCSTDYSLMSDTEAALCPDNGIFTSALVISSLAATLLDRLYR